MASLTRAWLLLLVLTFLAMWAGVSSGSLLPMTIQVAVVIGVAGLKGWTILDRYLGLRTSGAGWRTFFAAFLIVLCGGLLATYEVGCWRGVACGSGQVRSHQ